MSGADGASATGFLKVSVGYLDGWIGEGQISYAGANCLARGNMAISLMRERLTPYTDSLMEQRGELIGVNSVWPAATATSQPTEVRMRYAARCSDDETARMIGDEVEGLYLAGPAGGGGVTKGVRVCLAIASTLLPASQVTTHVEMMEVHNETA